MKKTTLFLLVAGIILSSMQTTVGMNKKEASGHFIKQMVDLSNEAWNAMLLQVINRSDYLRENLHRVPQDEIEFLTYLSHMSDQDLYTVIKQRIVKTNYKPNYYLHTSLRKRSKPVQHHQPRYKIQELPEGSYENCKLQIKTVFTTELLSELLELAQDEHSLGIKFTISLLLLRWDKPRNPSDLPDERNSTFPKHKIRKGFSVFEITDCQSSRIKEYAYRIVAAELDILSTARTFAKKIISQEEIEQPIIDDEEESSSCCTPKCICYCLLGTAGILYSFKRQAPEQFQTLVDTISDCLNPVWNLCKKLCPGEDRREHED